MWHGANCLRTRIPVVPRLAQSGRRRCRCYPRVQFVDWSVRRRRLQRSAGQKQRDLDQSGHVAGGRGGRRGHDDALGLSADGQKVDARDTVERRDGCRRGRAAGYLGQPVRGDGWRHALCRNQSRDRLLHRRASILASDGRWVELPIPDTATFDTISGGQVIVSLVDPLGSPSGRVGRRLRSRHDACRQDAAAGAGDGAECQPGDRGGRAQPTMSCGSRRSTTCRAN